MKLVVSAVLAACLAAGSTQAQPVFLETLLEAQGPLGPLKGTLLAPRTKPTAVVLIVPGSGPTDRDGNSPLGIKASSYRLLAEGLAERGVASLRIDKRGMFATREAVKDGNAVTVDDYADDVQSWVNVLVSETRSPCVWILGHSEGGLIALASASRLRGGCGFILVSTPGRPMGDVLRDQLTAHRAQGPVVDQALTAIEALEQGRRVDTKDVHPALQTLFDPAVQGFLISAFSYQPTRLLANISKPTLVLQGQRDIQVGEADARMLKEANPQATLVLLPDVNHVLKLVRSDDRRENIATYADPGLPLALEVVDSIAAFLAEASRMRSQLAPDSDIKLHLSPAPPVSTPAMPSSDHAEDPA